MSVGGGGSSFHSSSSPKAAMSTVHAWLIQIMSNYLLQWNPRIADTPEIWTSTVMWTLCSVPKVTYVSKTTPEVRTPFKSEYSEWVPGVSTIEGSTVTTVTLARHFAVHCYQLPHSLKISRTIIFEVCSFCVKMKFSR